MGSDNEMRRARWISVPTIGLSIVASITACGGSSGNNATTVTQTVQPTTTEPTRVRGSVGVAGNAPFAEWQLVKYDPELKQFGDYYAREFCKQDERLYSLEVSGMTLPHEYAFYRKKLGKPSAIPKWADDVEVKSMLGQYMVTHYCPWND